MRAIKTIFGILSIVFVMLIWLQSCTVGVINTVSESSNDAGTAGAVVGFALLIGGICGLVTRDSRIGGIITSLCYFFGAILGSSTDAGDFKDLEIWTKFAAICGVIFLIGAFTIKSKKKSQSSKDNTESTTNGNIEQLEKLVELKEKGVLTQEEFEKQKKALLEK